MPSSGVLCLFTYKMVSKQELESLLKVQREAYNDTIGHLISSFNSQIDSVKSELSLVKSELESSKEEISHQQSRITELTTRLEECELNLASFRSDPVEIFNRLDSLEDHSRRNNLRFEGIPELPRENWEQTAAEILKLARKIGIDHEIKIDRAHRIGNAGAGSRPRTIIARFHYYSDRELYLRNAHKLKGTRIFVNEDLCQTSLNKRKEKLPELQQARREGKTAYFSHTKLIIKDRARTDTANLTNPVVTPNSNLIVNPNPEALPTPASDSASATPQLPTETPTANPPSSQPTSDAVKPKSPKKLLPPRKSTRKT